MDFRLVLAEKLSILRELDCEHSLARSIIRTNLEVKCLDVPVIIILRPMSFAALWTNDSRFPTELYQSPYVIETNAKWQSKQALKYRLPETTA